jgi:alkylation response protein AidB-like acyl-CoA dehydrogenase
MTILSPELQELARVTRQRAWARLAPLAADVDRQQRFSSELWEEVCAMGVPALPFPLAEGGADASALAFLVTLEQIAYSCAVAALYPGTTIQVAQAILQHGAPTLRKRWAHKLISGTAMGAWAFTEPQTGSDPRQLTTRARAVSDGWVLDGQKAFISYAAQASVALVFARVDEGAVGAFLVETGQDGWTTGPAVEVLGFGGTGACPVYLDSVWVPADGLIGEMDGGFEVMLTGEALGKLRVSAINVGIAQRALDEAAGYALDRTHRSTPIGTKFGTIQALLADMNASVLSARALLHETAERYDAGQEIAGRAASLRLVTGRAAHEVTSSALQVCGAYGLTRDMVVERLYREGKFYDVAQGSLELQRVVSGKELLRRIPPGGREQWRDN